MSTDVLGTGDIRPRPEPAAELPEQSVQGAVRDLGDGLHQLDLLVEGAHCGGCLARIEGALNDAPGVAHARLNLTARHLVVRWSGTTAEADRLATLVRNLGYGVAPFDPAAADDGDQREQKALLRALAVAGFAAANVMLLSISIWAGHDLGMAAETRTLFHWISALIALPAVAYAARPFYRSAARALAAGHLNMDVPITLAVLLACGLSLHQTIIGAEHAYFDSATALVFFLLIGRFLDRRARGKARSAAHMLLAMQSRTVALRTVDGQVRQVPAEAVAVGDTVVVAPGERIGVDGDVVFGTSDLDMSAITGETTSVAARTGTHVHAGTISRTGQLAIEVTATGDDTLLAGIVRLLADAEQRKSRFVILADRIARAYAPVVHVLALATFAGWWLAGAAWQDALLYATAVLIITCPCALALAVPAVQVIASGRLFRAGVLLKSGAALERLAGIDTIMFDKTGTLTDGTPRLAGIDPPDPTALDDAAPLAAASLHPLARGIVQAAGMAKPDPAAIETPGMGIALSTPKGEIRLGSAEWCGVDAPPAETPELWLSRPDAAPVRFRFADTPRPDARETLARLKDAGYRIGLLSGDQTAPVRQTAEAVGIAQWRAALKPADKCAALAELRGQGARVLMVGDGLNDAPALAAADASMSPASGIAVTQAAADLVFQGKRLAPVAVALETARRANRLVRQNLWLSFGYNALMVPVAMAGYVTPLVAAVAMSTSSLLVVGNALRLARQRQLG